MKTKQTCKITLFFGLLGIASGLFSQNFQLAGVSFSSYERTKIKGAPAGQEIGFDEFSLFGKLPVKFKNQKTVLLNTFRYGLVQATTHNSPLFLDKRHKKDLHIGSLSVALIQKLGKKWTLIATVMPTVASDLERMTGGDFLQIQGSGLASLKLDEKWTAGSGLLYTTQLGEPRFLPIVQLRYLNKRHFVNVLLPSFASYLYEVGDRGKWQLGLRFETNGGNFNVNNNDFTKVAPNPINKAVYSRLNAGALVNFYLTKTVLLEGFAGISPARKFKLAAGSKMFSNYGSARGGFFSFGLMLTPPSKAD